jgi:hypothetical protein
VSKSKSKDESLNKSLVARLQKMGYVGTMPSTSSELRELVEILNSIP